MRFLKIFLLLIPILAFAQVSEIALQDHALRLAIAHFNPNHERALKQSDDSHLFMLHFLKEAINKVPALANLPFYPAENRYRILTVQMVDADSHQKLFELNGLKKAFRSFSKDCPFEQKRIFGRSNMNAEEVKSKELKIKAFLEFLPLQHKNCRHLLIQNFAKKLDLAELEWNEFNDKNTHNINVNFISQISQDLNYVQKTLLNNSSALPQNEFSILKSMSPAPFSRQNDYYESMIILHPLPAEFGPVTLLTPVFVEFVDRFERHGQIFTYHWLLQGTPTQNASFNIQVIKEWGTPRNFIR